MITRLISASIALLTCFAVSPLADAANPASGTLTPSSTTALSWTGTATGGATPDEPTGVVGVSLDVFTLTITGTADDYPGKSFPVAIEWALPASDYDLVIRKENGREAGYQKSGDNADDIVASSGNSPPATREEKGIPLSALNASGTTDFYVVAVYFAATSADQYTGTAASVLAGPPRSPSYQASNLTFSPNTRTKAPAAGQDGEPSSRIDALGNYYIGGIRGIPAGVDLWYFDLKPDSPTYDPMMKNPIYRGQPDNLSEIEGTAGDGGGDIDLAVGFGPFTGTGTQGNPALAFTSLVLANISTGRSLDLGQTFELNPVGNLTGGPPGDDREWNEFFGPNSVYLLYRTIAPTLAQVQRSNDGGYSYSAASQLGPIGQVGCLDVDQFDGTVYASGSTGLVSIGIPNAETEAAGVPPPLFTNVMAVSGAGDPANIFFQVKVADDNRDANGQIIGPGTVYVCYSDGKDIFIAHSTSRRDAPAAERDTAPVVFSAPVRVNSRTNSETNLLPWMETGPTPGTVGVVWYGNIVGPNNNASQWRVLYSYSTNASELNPVFNEAIASDHIIHGSNISLNGLDPTGEGSNRNLIDYFQLAFDPTGAAVIGYTDDHNDFQGHSYVTRQISGLSINDELDNIGGDDLVPTSVDGAELANSIASNKAGTLPGIAAPLVVSPGPNGEQVTDHLHDAAAGLNTTPDVDSPTDILSIKYSSQDTRGGRLLTATMRVSDLQNFANNSYWRMTFAANAPDARDISNGVDTYSSGDSDHGDQFYLRANVTAQGARTYDYGRVTRNGDGSLTYTRVGPADRGSIDRATDTVSVSISMAKINALLSAASKPQLNTTTNNVLSGLRGTANGGGVFDETRGGTLFHIGGPLPAQ